MTIKKASTSNLFGIQKFNSTKNASESLVELQRIDATGGTITFFQQNGINYKVHTFTGTSNFTVLNKGQSPFVEYLIIGGGGAGGGWYGGGGGAGGHLSGTATVDVGAYLVQIGSGGTGGNNNTFGRNGQSSTAFGLTAIAGGGGAWTNGGAGSGGSGGGGGGTGTVGQGNNGGGSSESGGGGAGEVGQTDIGGRGGNGLPSAINGSMIYRAGGGGGSNYYGTGNSNGGIGGGGWGGFRQSRSGQNGQDNTGGGGGGGSELTSGNGGSGIAIIRYQI